MTEIAVYQARFETIRRLTPYGADCWTARELQEVLGYGSWDNFKAVIAKARQACIASGVSAPQHFHDSVKKVAVGSGAMRDVEDMLLSRYAAYLIAMNADSSKEVIAAAQTYFAVQTRRQELQDQETDDEKRLRLRDRVRDANKDLTSAAKKAGVQRYAIFHDAGYKGLYGGLGVTEIKGKKGIPEGEHLLDCVDRAELAANEFRITQTEQKLKREAIQGESLATAAHRTVGRQVREAIKKIGGTMPEDLPSAPSIKKLVASKRKHLPKAQG